MANGADPDEFAEPSRRRQGLKRELTFALSQVDVCCSLGRTRARKPEFESPPETQVSWKKAKRTKKKEEKKGGVVVSEDDAKSAVVDLMSDDERRGHVVESVKDSKVNGDEGKKMDVDSENLEEKPILRYSRATSKRRTRVAAEATKMEEKGHRDVEVKKDVVEMAVDKVAELAKEREEELKTSEGEKAECEVVSEKPIVLYTRSPLKRNKRYKVAEDELKNVMGNMVVDDELRSGVFGDSVTEDVAKQEEMRMNVSEQPLAQLEILDLSEKNDKMESFYEPNFDGGGGDFVTEGEPKEEDLKTGGSEQPSVQLEILDQIEKNDTMESVDEPDSGGGGGDFGTEGEPRQEELKMVGSEQPSVQLEIRDPIEKNDTKENKVTEDELKQVELETGGSEQPSVQLEMLDQIEKNDMMESVDEPNSGGSGDFGTEGEPKQEELKMGGSEQPSVLLETRDPIEKNDTTENKVTKDELKQVELETGGAEQLSVQLEILDPVVKSDIMESGDEPNCSSSDLNSEDDSKHEEFDTGGPEQLLVQSEVLDLSEKSDKMGSVDELNSSRADDAVIEGEPKQEELKTSGPEQPSVQLEILDSIEKSDMMESEVTEDDEPKLEELKTNGPEQYMVQLETLDPVEKSDMMETEVTEDEPKQEELKTSGAGQPLVQSEILDLSDKCDKMESVNEPSCGVTGDLVTEDEPDQEELKTSGTELPLTESEILDLMEKSDKMETDDEPNAGGAVDSVTDDPKQEELKTSGHEQPLVQSEVLDLIEKSDKMETDDETNSGATADSVIEDDRKQEELKTSGHEQPLVQSEVLDLIEKSDKMETDDEPNPGGAGDAENEDEPKQAELRTIEPEQPLVKLGILDLIKKSDKMEREVSEKPKKKFARSAVGAENKVHRDMVSQKTSSVKVEMKMPETVKNFTLSELLRTGILEGQPVTYRKVSKGEVTAEKGLTGVIKGSQILCHCKRCNGANAVSPVIFEMHAGSTNKRPPAYIYLQNGNTLRDVLTACDSSLKTLEEAVRLAVGCSSIKRCNMCLNCKGPVRQDKTRPAMLLCGSCFELKVNQKFSVADNSEGRDSSSKCPGTVQKSSSSASKSRGRVTKKDIGMHKLVFEDDVLEDGTELSYIHNGQILASGYKKGSGFVCKCHDQEVSPSQLEAHAGCSSRRKPYHNIFLSNGMSLHELALKLSMKRTLSTKDSLCQICKKGGKFICCNSCPRVYHAGCLSLPTVPDGSWYCNHCQTLFDKQKDADNHVNAVAAGRVPGGDPMEQITNRCIRVITASDEKFGGCSLCSGHEFKNEGFGPGTVILCDQCEREFHIGCLKEKGIADLKEVPKDKWFCHPACLRNYSALQKLVAHGQQKLPDAFLEIIKQKHSEKGLENGVLDVKWRVLSGKISTGDESLELLSKALAIFHDQFAPIIDKDTGHDFIREMLYGGAIKTQEFGGMHCAIITVNGSVVSAAMFRIYGTDVAELPLVATSADFQGLGYFQNLFSCIQRFLGFLRVQVILLPAADEAASIWTKKFGFQNLSQNEIHEYRKQFPILIFDGTSVLKKSVGKCRLTGSKPKS